MDPLDSAPRAPDAALAVFTIGYATMPAERLVNNLRAYDMHLLVDVRPPAFLAHAPQFEPERVAARLQANGLDYAYLGEELCGLPDDPECYDRHGFVLYDRVAARPGFQRAVEGLLHDLARGRRTALACVEGKPRDCHRRLLVGRVLRSRGVGLAHILPDGGLISEAELLDDEAALPRQLSFSGEALTPPWRSATPVPPDLRPGRS